MWKRIVILIFILWICVPNYTYASDTQEEIEEELFTEFDFSEIESFLQEQFPEEKTGFLDLIKQLISGEAEFSLETILDMLSDQFFYEFKMQNPASSTSWQL